MAQALAAGDRAGRRPVSARSCRPTRGRGRAQHRADGRRRGHPRRRRARRSSGRSICVFAATGEQPASVFTRSLVVIEQGARVMLIESHEAGRRGYQVNTALELVVGDDAHVDHIKITGEARATVHVSSLMAAIGANARFNDFAFTIGGARGAQPALRALRRRGHASPASRGASLLKGKQHVDTTLVVDHAGRRLPEPRAVHDRARRREPRRVPGQDHRAASTRRRPTPR